MHSNTFISFSESNKIDLSCISFELITSSNVQQYYLAYIILKHLLCNLLGMGWRDELKMEYLFYFFYLILFLYDF